MTVLLSAAEGETVRLIIMLVVLMAAAPATAQRLYTNADLGRPAAPATITPAEAVRVLRASQSPYDVTDLPFYGGEIGPLILIGGGASVRDWPREAYAPIRPLSEPWSSTTYLGHGFRSRSAAPIVTLSPWTMRAFVGPDRSASRSAGEHVGPSTAHQGRRR